MSGAAISLAAVIVGLALAEFAARVAAPPDERFAQYDARVGYVLAPNFTRVVHALEHSGGRVKLSTNNLGLRHDEDIRVEKPAGTVRVLVLGDSQTEGIVENRESYSARLEAMLSAMPGFAGYKVEVLNAAASGYMPLLEYLWLRKWGGALAPDLIVVAVYAGNDIAELLAHEVNFGGYGPRFRIPVLERSGSGWRIVYPASSGSVASRVDFFLDRHLWLYRSARRAAQRWGGQEPALLARLAGRCIGCLQSLPQAYTAGGKIAALKPGFAKLDYLLDRLRHEAHRLGSRLLVLVIPTKLEVEPMGVRKEVSAAVELLGLAYDPVEFDAAVRRRIVSIARQRGLVVVDLLPPLRSAAESGAGPLYWVLDWHLSGLGHRVVAARVAPAAAEILGRNPRRWK